MDTIIIEDFPSSDEESTVIVDDEKHVEAMKSLQRNTNWELVDERRKFIRQVHPLIKQPYCQWPNFHDILRSEDVERLAMDYINFVEFKDNMMELGEFIGFVCMTGFKDEPKLDAEGKPSSRRTTPVHHAAKQDRYMIIKQDLFEIYNRYDVNYTDESGLSHFHVACMEGYDDAVKKFLEFGHDPDCIWTETGDTPLHLYLIGKNEYLRYSRNAVTLLRKSANLNLANKDGLTPLHIISKRYTVDPTTVSYPLRDIAKFLFEISDEKQQPLQIDARDKLGNTPLHLAVIHYNDYVIQLLLRRGADPNSANDEGSTPLHLFYQRDHFKYDVEGSVKLFFKICDEVNQSVQVDARDKLGRTPLQLAVANFWPESIDILFERGADLSNFIFPTESYFAEGYKSLKSDISSIDRLKLTSGALAAVEKIVKKGYQLEQSDAMTIMKFFAEYELFEKSSDLEKCWYDDEEFITSANAMLICPGLSRIPIIILDIEEMLGYYGICLTLDELLRLRPEKAAKLLTYEDYWKFSVSCGMIDFSDMFNEEHQLLISLHLCEKVSRGFFRSWAQDPFMKLIHNRLPILCCEMIIEHLSNQDLYNICLAAAGKSS